MIVITCQVVDYNNVPLAGMRVLLHSSGQGSNPCLQAWTDETGLVTSWCTTSEAPLAIRHQQEGDPSLACLTFYTQEVLGSGNSPWETIQSEFDVTGRRHHHTILRVDRRGLGYHIQHPEGYHRSPSGVSDSVSSHSSPDTYDDYHYIAGSSSETSSEDDDEAMSVLELPPPVLYSPLKWSTSLQEGYRDVISRKRKGMWDHEEGPARKRRRVA